MATEEQKQSIKQVTTSPVSKEFVGQDIKNILVSTDYVWAYKVKSGFIVAELTGGNWAIYRGTTKIYEDNFADTLSEITNILG